MGIIGFVHEQKSVRIPITYALQAPIVQGYLVNMRKVEGLHNRNCPIVFRVTREFLY